MSKRKEAATPAAGQDTAAVTETMPYPMGFVRIPLELIDDAPWNYKKNDAEQDEKLVANLAANGQVENIIVRWLPEEGRFEAVNGNHRRRVFGRVGIDEPMCYNGGVMSLEAAQRLAIETNETRYDSDALKLAQMVKHLADVYPMPELELTLPYTTEELTSMVNLSAFDWSPPNVKPSRRRDLGEDGLVEVRIRVPQEIADLWEAWRERCKEQLGYDIEGKAFELCVVEAMNTPVVSTE